MTVRSKRTMWGSFAIRGGFKARAVFGSLAIVIGLLSGCGYVGDTKPPTLDIPLRITDLRAAEYGSKIAVEFTLPLLTTEGLPLKNPRSVEVRITGDGQDQMYPAPTKVPGPIAFDIPAQEWIGKAITITARATGPKGKVSEWSNAVMFNAGPPLLPPGNVEAKNAPDGVTLSWTGSGSNYRIFRTTGEGMPERLTETPSSPYKDTSAALGTRYTYMIQALESEQRLSELSAPVAITPKDEFAPAVPVGLSAVAGADSIELSWERNTEDDFLNYNVYRSVGDAPFEKLAGGVEPPVFSDRMIEAGKRYRYTVSAVDVNGNESARSMVAEAVAP